MLLGWGLTTTVGPTSFLSKGCPAATALLAGVDATVEAVDTDLEVENLRNSPLPMVLTELLLTSVLVLLELAVWIEIDVGGELPPNMLVRRPRSVDYYLCVCVNVGKRWSVYVCGHAYRLFDMQYANVRIHAD